MRKEIEKKNLELEEQRREYEKFKNEIEITVYSPLSFDLIGGTLHPKQNVDEVPEHQIGSLFFSVVTDKRASVSSLKERVFTTLSGFTLRI